MRNGFLSTHAVTVRGSAGGLILVALDLVAQLDCGKMTLGG